MNLNQRDIKLNTKALHNRSDLCFIDYWWSNYTNTDERISGPLDGTNFNKIEGNQVLYLINALVQDWGLAESSDAKKIEKMLRNGLPQGISSQMDVKIWIRLNWKFH